MTTLVSPRTVRTGRIRHFAVAAILTGLAASISTAQQPPQPASSPPTVVAAGPAAGQSAPASRVQVSVRDVQADGTLIRVPANKSILVDFNVPVREARLAKPDFAEVTAISPQQLLITGKSFGTTQLIVWVDGNEQRVFDLAVDIELDRLLASVRSAVPRANVRAHTLMDAVVLTGDVADAASAERVEQIAKVYSPNVMNHLRVRGGQQVLLRCTVAEVNRSASRELGFNGWIAGDDVRDMFFINNLDGINPSNIGAPEGALATADIPFLVGEDGIPVTGRSTLSFGFPRVQMQVFVQALRENGLLRILAEPNLLAINGQEATFLAGGEIPIPIITDERINVIFKEFGVRLNFMPVVLGEGRIRLKVTPEISEPDFANSVTLSGVSVPAFSTRRLETTVELGAGQTLAIGGLLSERTRAVSRKVPGLGDVSVLGSLFTSVDYQQDETELVVLVTPDLSEGISSDQVTAVPGANYVAPNDFELFMLGQLDGQSATELPVLQPRVNQVWPAQPAELYGDSSLKLRGPVGPSGGDEGS